MTNLNKDFINKLSLEQATEWRYPIWTPAISFSLEKGSKLLRPGSRVLEIGYNSGLMSIYMAKEFGYHVDGYEVNEQQQINASKLAKRYGVEGKVNFYACPPEKTKDTVNGPYDAIFIKSFLYHNKNLKDYLAWIDWFKSLLKTGGVLMATENGQGNYLSKLYRKKFLKNCTWKENYFFDVKVEEHLKKNFSKVHSKYFGGISQFATSFPNACHFLQKFENPDPNNCFVASVTAVK